MEEAQWAQPLRRQLADADEAAGGVHATRDRRHRRVGHVEIGERDGLPVGEPAPALGGNEHGEEVCDRAVGREHVRAQPGGVAFLDRHPWDGVLEPESPHPGPLERLDVTAAAERFPEIGGQAADVGTRPAGHAGPETRTRPLEELERVDVNATRRPLDLDPRPR
jgi:hypothetical protein